MATARAALAQLRSGDVVRVPRVLYKLTAAAPRILPRPVIRRDSGLLHRSKEEGA
jgi:hypothetical protein